MGYRLICFALLSALLFSCEKKEQDDIYAMNCAAAIGGRTNMNRFGQNYFGNEAMIESYMMMPLRYDRDDSDEE